MLLRRPSASCKSCTLEFALAWQEPSRGAVTGGMLKPASTMTG